MDRRQFLASAVAAVAANPQPISAMASNGSMIVAAVGQVLHVYNNRGQLVQTLEGHRDRINCVAVSGNEIASGGLDGHVMVWTNGVGKGTRYDHSVTCMDYCGRDLCVGGFTSTLRIGRSTVALPSRDIRAVVSDGRSVVCGGRGGVIYSFYNGRLTPQRIDAMAINCMTLVKGNVVYGGDRGVVGTATSSARLVEGDVRSICTIDANHVAIGTTRDEIAIVSLANLKVVRTLKGHTGTVTGLYYGNALISSALDGQLKQWTV